MTVVDRGFSSDANLAYLTRAGGHWIAGERMRDGSPDALEALSRQGRYQAVRDNLRVKDVRVDGSPGKRWIVCHNPGEAERDEAQRDAAVARLEAELDAIAKARARDAAKAKKTGKKRSSKVTDDAHRKAECALRDHKTLSRYLRQTTTGRLLIDRAAIRAEERLDGKFLLRTSDPTLSAEDVALGYKQLLEVERGWRDMKSTLDLRPVYHHLERRILAHVLLCWLALLLIRLAETATGDTWRNLRHELDRMYVGLFAGPRRPGPPTHRNHPGPGGHPQGSRG
ncbi:MAG: IS1634 family transposase [Actinobacteria bacterium]|nr:IS1634 family transposase [Actinomycetota bacterium]